MTNDTDFQLFLRLPRRSSFPPFCLPRHSPKPPHPTTPNQKNPPPNPEVQSPPVRLESAVAVTDAASYGILYDRRMVLSLCCSPVSLKSAPLLTRHHKRGVRCFLSFSNIVDLYQSLRPRVNPILKYPFPLAITVFLPSIPRRHPQPRSFVPAVLRRTGVVNIPFPPSFPVELR